MPGTEQIIYIGETQMSYAVPIIIFWIIFPILISNLIFYSRTSKKKKYAVTAKTMIEAGHERFLSHKPLSQTERKEQTTDENQSRHTLNKSVIDEEILKDINALNGK